MPAPNDFTVGWICAVGTELVAAQSFLDEKYDVPDHVPVNDNNAYTLGRMGRHNIVIAAMPHWQYGLVSAATSSRDMLRSFPNLRIGLMVGVGGGAPSKKHDIRLGDVVVSSPGYANGGVLQYDYGKTIQDESFTVTGYLNQPPQFILTALSVLEAEYESEGHLIHQAVDAVLQERPKLKRKYHRPDAITDRLHIPTFKHPREDADCKDACGNCISNLVPRNERAEDENIPAIHYGLIASANQLMTDALIRDKLSAEKDVICFEMEAAGLMNHFPCLVVRGICDYSDTHKNEAWQGYAAMAAAAYAKDLLRKIAPNKVEAEKKLSDVLSDVDKKLTGVQSIVESIQQDNHALKLGKWLSPSDPSTNLNKALESRHEGTGSWFLNSPEYSTWKIKKNSFLWLNGIPGCGKTVLASTIVEDLEKRDIHSPNLLYFYFDFSDTRKQTVQNMLHSLIMQLQHKRKDVRDHLDSLYSTSNNGQRGPGLAMLQKAFQDMIQRSGNLWIVLDALDECGKWQESQSLLQWIEKLRRPGANIHILVTSRPEQYIESSIRQWAHTGEIIPLQGVKVRNDIRDYIQARVRESQGLNRWRDRHDVQKEIENTLVEKADGMFRWVACQLDALEDSFDYESLQEALRSLPDTLDETYSRILTKMSHKHRRHTIRILQFLVHSKYPPRLDELVDAIAVKTTGATLFNPNDRLPDPREITRYCSGLVVVGKERTEDSGVTRDEYSEFSYINDDEYSEFGYDDDSKSTDTLQLAHYSVKEWLTSNRLEKDMARSLSKVNASASIAKICLAYIIQVGRNVTPHGKLLLSKPYPLIHYARRYWNEGPDKTEEEASSETLRQLILEFLSCENAFKLFHSYKNDGLPLFQDILPSKLHWAVFRGLVHTVQNLLHNGADANCVIDTWGSHISRAVNHNKVKIAQVLIDNGANVNEMNWDKTLLSLAASNDYEEMVKMLLRNGADINLGTHTALHNAANRGCRGIVQVLLDNGAKIDAVDEFGNTALICAANNGHERIVQTLLDRGADVNVMDGFGWTALIYACEHGFESIVQTLLDEGAEVNTVGKSRDGKSRDTALKRAEMHRYKGIIQLLLDKGGKAYALDRQVLTLGETPQS